MTSTRLPHEPVLVTSCRAGRVRMREGANDAIGGSWGRRGRSAICPDDLLDPVDNELDADRRQKEPEHPGEKGDHRHRHEPGQGVSG